LGRSWVSGGSGACTLAFFASGWGDSVPLAPQLKRVIPLFVFDNTKHSFVPLSPVFLWLRSPPFFIVSPLNLLREWIG